MIGLTLATILPPWNEGGVVGEMEIPLDLQEPLPRNPRCHREVVESVGGGPVIIQVGQPVQTHEDGESQVCSEFFTTSLPFRHQTISLVCGCKTGCCIPVGLHDNVDHFGGEKERNISVESDETGTVGPVALLNGSTTTFVRLLDHSASWSPVASVLRLLPLP